MAPSPPTWCMVARLTAMDGVEENTVMVNSAESSTGDPPQEPWVAQRRTEMPAKMAGRGGRAQRNTSWLEMLQHEKGNDRLPLPLQPPPLFLSLPPILPLLSPPFLPPPRAGCRRRTLSRQRTRRPGFGWFLPSFVEGSEQGDRRG